MVDIKRVYKQICTIAAEEQAEKVILFGSRARGTNYPKSDIDIAISGCPNFGHCKDRLENELWSLLNIDVVDLDTTTSLELKQAIAREGKVLYEKVR